MQKKQLIVNADDFGFTHDVNAGIIEAHRHGILTATTLMANGDAFDDAVRLAWCTPSLDVGCHLVLIQGCSIVTGEALPETPKKLLRALLAKKLNVYAELRAQIEKLLEAGIRPSHLDTHKHTHIVPAVCRIVMRLASEFSIPFVRMPFDYDWFPMRALERRYRRSIRRNGLRATNHFAGFRLTDSLDERYLEQILRQLPDGATELMCHPGYLGAELRKAPTRLKETRERELKALTSPKMRQLIADLGISLTSYRGLMRESS